MTLPKLRFLPAFFTTLAIVFAIALALRIRSYRDEVAVDPAPVVPGSSSQAAGATSPQPVPIEQAGNASASPVADTDMPRRPRRSEAIPFIPPPPAPAATANVQKTTPTGVVASTAKPSLFSRIVSPIVAAITGSSKPAQGSSGAQQTPMQSSSGGGRSGATGTSGSGNGTSTADPNDPNSDTQPPQLVAISFAPPTIHDGEETVLTIQATDNLSGVRSISGTIAAPSGAVQGFACQRQGDADLYVAHIAVPKEAAEGIWRVNYLSLIDNASNAATLSGAQNGLPPSATFRVTSSASDTQGPTLKAIWLDRPAMKAGEKDTVFVEAEDDKSGVDLVSGVFISPAKKARIGFVCRPGDGATWQGDVSTPACIDCGDWQLEQVQLRDKANNMTTLHADNPLIAAVRLSVSGTSCDSTPPEISSLVLDRNVVSNAQDSIITVTATATDDACGIMSMSGQVTGPTTGGAAPRLYFSFSAGGDQQTWVGRITVPKLAAKGTWRISWVQVQDQAHNLTTYSLGDRPLVNGVFTVQ